MFSQAYSSVLFLGLASSLWSWLGRVSPLAPGGIPVRSGLPGVSLRIMTPYFPFSLQTTHAEMHKTHTRIKRVAHHSSSFKLRGREWSRRIQTWVTLVPCFPGDHSGSHSEGNWPRMTEHPPLIPQTLLCVCPDSLCSSKLSYRMVEQRLVNVMTFCEIKNWAERWGYLKNLKGAVHPDDMKL